MSMAKTVFRSPLPFLDAYQAYGENSQPMEEHYNTPAMDDLFNTKTSDVESEIPTIEEEATSSMPEALPFLVAHQVQTAIGDKINQNMYDASQSQNIKQYDTNSLNTGALGQTTAKNVFDWNTQQNINTKDAGALGNEFGFLGLAAGHMIGEANESSIPQDLKDTAWSSQGRIDPTSDGVDQTFNTSAISSDEMANGAQVSENSSSIDDTPQ